MKLLVLKSLGKDTKCFIVCQALFFAATFPKRSNTFNVLCAKKTYLEKHYPTPTKTGKKNLYFCAKKTLDLFAQK